MKKNNLEIAGNIILIFKFNYYGSIDRNNTIIRINNTKYVFFSSECK